MKIGIEEMIMNGRLQAFGLTGVVFGPLLATVCSTLIEIHIQGTKRL